MGVLTDREDGLKDRVGITEVDKVEEVDFIMKQKQRNWPMNSDLSE